MKRKSGLHKKVSSIFGESSLSLNPPAKTPPVDNSPAGPAKTEMATTDLSAPGVVDNSARPEHPYNAPAARPARKTVAKVVAPVLTEDQEYAASQRRKLLLVIALGAGLSLVLFFNFYQPGKKTVASEDTLSALIIPSKASEIYWPKPEIWPADTRDPMVFKANAAKLYAVESKIEGPLVLRGIVHRAGGGSMVLIGTEIYYKGDEVEGWTIKEVLKDIVRVENSDGEKLELKMEDR